MSKSINKTPDSSGCDKLFGDVIYSYTRAQAIAEGSTNEVRLAG